MTNLDLFVTKPRALRLKLVPYDEIQCCGGACTSSDENKMVSVLFYVNLWLGRVGKFPDHKTSP